MEKLAKDEIKQYYGKRFVIKGGNGCIYTITKKGSKNSYLNWSDTRRGVNSTERSNKDILKNIKDGVWVLEENEINKYYNSLFYVAIESQVLYKIEKNDEGHCNVSLLNDKSKTATKGLRQNSDVLSNFKNGIWVLFEENKVTSKDYYMHYYAPHDLFNGAIKKDTIYELYTNEYGEVWAKPAHFKENNKYILPKEVVLKWKYITNIVGKPVRKRDLKLGDWVVILKEDDCYNNCEQGKPQKVVNLDEGLKNDYVKVSFSDGKTNPKYYKQMRRATKEEIAIVETTEVNYNISDVINKISI